LLSKSRTTTTVQFESIRVLRRESGHEGACVASSDRFSAVTRPVRGDDLVPFTLACRWTTVTVDAAMTDSRTAGAIGAAVRCWTDKEDRHAEELWRSLHL
jgi:hypothetical protein